jgi:DinB superfamily
MSFDLPRSLEVLQRTPLVLESLLDGLSDEWLDATEGPDTFSPRDVVGHLIHGEETDWVPRIRLILERGEEEPFTPFDRFGFREKIKGRGIDDLLRELRNLRAENLDYVRGLSLSPSDFDRKGRHPALGTVTLGQLFASWVVHDLGHVRQVVRVLARQYGEAVGPWKEYLRILEER